MKWPVVQLHTPSTLALRSSDFDFDQEQTPFGHAYWQVLRRENVLGIASELATSIGADVCAQVHIEPVLRWRVHNTNKEDREPVVLSHNTLAGINPGDYVSDDFDPLDRNLVPDALLLVVACQIVVSNEAWQTYQETLSTLPISGIGSSLIAVDVPRAEVLTPAQVAALQPREKKRRETLTSKFGRIGESIFTACKNYPTTLDMVAVTGAEATLPIAAPAAQKPVEQPAAPRNDDDDDMSIDAIAARYAGTPVQPPPVEQPVHVVQPGADIPPSWGHSADHDVKLKTWRLSCLHSRKFGINIIVRGYVRTDLVRKARRLASKTGDMFYILPACVITPTPTDIPKPEPQTTSNDDDDTEPSIQDVANQPMLMPTKMRQFLPDETSQSLQPIVPLWESHLLDRLARLDMSKLTFYEVDRAIRDRFSVHNSLYSHWKTQTELENKVLVCMYPRSHRAPIPQPYITAPGLLATATPYDYAAIGLAGLCVIVAMAPDLHQWLLDAEAYYYRIRVPDSQPHAYLTRIEYQIANSRAPAKDTELYRLLSDIVVSARSKIADVDSRAPPSESFEEGSSSDPDGRDEDHDDDMSEEVVERLDDDGDKYE